MNQKPFTTSLLIPDQPTIIGVSGGADSLCLLHLLHSSGYQVIVAYFNHRLRPEAEAEADYVRQMAESLHLPFAGGCGEVRAFAMEQVLSLEEAARLLRYRFLFDQARQHRAQAVATGHTADDQVETVLMHLLRGSGLAGLKGMRPRTLLPEFDPSIPLVRPILHLWRNETEEFCRVHNLQPVLDSSNLEQTYFRNRLRHSLIPTMEKYNPQFKMVLFRTAEALAGDYEAVQEAVETAWQQGVMKTGDGFISFSASSLAQIAPGLRRNLLRRAMESLRPDLRNISFETLQRAANFVDAGSHPDASTPPRKMDLCGAIRMLREGDVLTLARSSADLPADEWPQIEAEQILPLQGKVELSGGFILQAAEVNLENGILSAIQNDDENIAYLDADLVGDALTIRSRRPGDVFSPLGMDGQTMKLQDFFVNLKLPLRVRKHWPLILAGEQIVWIPGLRLAHPFRLTDSTRRVLKFSLQSK